MVRAALIAPIKNMNIAMMSANVNFAVHLPMARVVRTVRLANTAMVQVRINVFGAVQQAMVQGVPIARPENTKSRRILIEFTFCCNGVLQNLVKTTIRSKDTTFTLHRPSPKKLTKSTMPNRT